MADLQAQLSLQNKLMQSIKDELAGVKRTLVDRATVRAERKTGIEIKIEATHAMVCDMCDLAHRNDERMAAIMAHLGLPDIEIEGDEVEQRS
jgi:hypothetical protein